MGQPDPRALAEDRFCLYAQPIIATRGADATTPPYVELLLRMLDEHDQLVPPMAFIPAAERYNLMPAIDRWVIRTAFAHARAAAASARRETSPD